MFQRYVKRTVLLVRNVEYFQCKSFRSISNQSPNNDLSIAHEVSRATEFDNSMKRTVPLSHDEYRSLKIMEPSQPENPHLLKVSILGEPNVGKSTLTNALVKWRVCAVSRKVHTTRKKAKAVLVVENKQIVFLDTPGFVTPEITKKHSLEPSFVMDPKRSIIEADLIAVVVDISDKWINHRINPEILRILYDFKDKKSILVLNKIDALKSKDGLLRLTQILTNDERKNKKGENKDLSVSNILVKCDEHTSTEKDVDSTFYENIDEKRGWPLFSKVFMVSGLKNDGVEELRNYLLSEAVPKDWLFNEGLVTDQHPHDIALMTVRQNLLEYLPKEIPYKIDLKITKWEMLSTGCPKINIKVVCPNTRYRRFVIGPGGKHIAACVASSKKAMRESFRRDVVLNLAVV